MFGFEKHSISKKSLEETALDVIDKIPMFALEEESTDLEVDCSEVGNELVIKFDSRRNPELNRTLQVPADRKVLLSRRFKKDMEKMIGTFVDEYLELEDKKLHEKGIVGQAMSEQEAIRAVTDSLAANIASLAVKNGYDVLVAVKNTPELPIVVVERQDLGGKAWVLNLPKEYILGHPSGFDTNLAEYFLDQARNFFEKR